MSTSKKDCVAVAAILKSVREGAEGDNRVGQQIGVSFVAIRLADYFGNQNPKFDKERFLKAAGIGE